MTVRRISSISISRKKAYTATAFDVRAHELAAVTQRENASGRLLTVDDTTPLVSDGYPLADGAAAVDSIGVRGGGVEQRTTVANARVERFRAHR